MQASLLTVDSPCWAGNCLKPNMEKVRLGRLAGRGQGLSLGLEHHWLAPLLSSAHHWTATGGPTSPDLEPDLAERFLCETVSLASPQQVWPGLMSWIRDYDLDHAGLISESLFIQTPNLSSCRYLQSISLCWWIGYSVYTILTLTCQLEAQCM